MVDSLVWFVCTTKHQSILIRAFHDFLTTYSFLLFSYASRKPTSPPFIFQERNILPYEIRKASIYKYVHESTRKPWRNTIYVTCPSPLGPSLRRRASLRSSEVGLYFVEFGSTYNTAPYAGPYLPVEYASPCLYLHKNNKYEYVGIPLYAGPSY
jgi:hypothetical protein